jgi:hypothetical protein
MVAARAVLLSFGFKTTQISTVFGPATEDSPQLHGAIALVSPTRAVAILKDAPEGTTASATIDMMVIRCGAIPGAVDDTHEAACEEEYAAVLAGFESFPDEDMRLTLAANYYNAEQTAELRGECVSRGFLAS